MTAEKKLQGEIIEYLERSGAYVLKTKPGGGIPVGCPDIIALYKDRYIAIEVKESSTASYQPGQKYTLRKLSEGNPYVFVAFPENWEAIRSKLQAFFF